MPRHTLLEALSQFDQPEPSALSPELMQEIFEHLQQAAERDRPSGSI